MDSTEGESKVLTGLSKLVHGLVCGISITLGVLGLLYGLSSLVAPRPIGRFVFTIGLVNSLAFAAGAIFTGHVSRFKLGYWSGYACLILVPLSLVIPPLHGDPVASPQASAVGSLRTLNTAEITYTSTYSIGYSPTLSCLAPPPDGANPTAKAAGLIDSILAGTGNTSEKNGYRFVYSPGPRDQKGRINSYTITASPVTPGTTGSYYYTDQTGVIRQNSTAPASAADSPIAG